MYDYDSNAILVQTIPNRQAQTIANAWENLTKRINMNGHKYNNFILDNGIYAELKNAFKNTISNMNVCHQKIIEEMQPNGKHKRLRIIFWQV